MRLRMTARRVGLRDSWRSDLEDRLRLLLGSWTSRIRQANVRIEGANGPERGLDVRCAIEAALIPSGTVLVQGWGADVDTAVRGAARRLVRGVRGDFYRKPVGERAVATAGNAASPVAADGSDERAAGLAKQEEARPTLGTAWSQEGEGSLRSCDADPAP